MVGHGAVVFLPTFIFYCLFLFFSSPPPSLSLFLPFSLSRSPFLSLSLTLSPSLSPLTVSTFLPLNLFKSLYLYEYQWSFLYFYPFTRLHQKLSNAKDLSIHLSISPSLPLSSLTLCIFLSSSRHLIRLDLVSCYTICGSFAWSSEAELSLKKVISFVHITIFCKHKFKISHSKYLTCNDPLKQVNKWRLSVYRGSLWYTFYYRCLHF